jgi:formate-dependent nitrite reductase membrane component NrfD
MRQDTERDRVTGDGQVPAYERRWEARGGGRAGTRSVADETRTSYYGQPVIHKPEWKWLIIAYFFLGGIASGTYVLASIADLLGPRSDRRIVRAGRYLSLAALIPCPILLILDLGRPERFHHMLRVFKLRSPMSVGTWGLTVFGAFCALAALIQAARDGLLGRTNGAARLLCALPSRAIDLAGAAAALLVGGYTGVLLAATAVPLWTKNSPLMGPLFLASAASSSTAAIALTLALVPGTKHRTLLRLERLDAIFLAAEAALLGVSWLRVGRTIARPLTAGRLGWLNGLGVVGLGIAVPLALQVRALLAGAAPAPGAPAAAAALVLAGGYLFRCVLVMAGHKSADDPHATFEAFGRPAGAMVGGGAADGGDGSADDEPRDRP